MQMSMALSDEIDLSSVLSSIVLAVCFIGWALFMVVNPLINWGVTVQFSPLHNSSFSLIGLSICLAMQLAVEEKELFPFLIMQPGFWSLALWY